MPKLLNLLYVNKWSKLEVGRVRYGVMCAEDGVVLDDGVTGRLAEDHYLMSTTSSGAATVWEWVENWLQTEHPDWRVHVTPVTTAYASINVAGPRSRELMGRLVEGVDLSPDAFGYMHVRTGRVAGVDDCVLWRIGFTGELSYEMHVPAGYGLHVWSALLEHGRDLGVGPVRGGGAADPAPGEGPLHRRPGHRRPDQGVQRRPRPAGEAGQGRTSPASRSWSGSTGTGRGPGWSGCSRSTGRWCRRRRASWWTASGSAGRVTSSRHSPTLGRSVCLAQVDAELAVPGRTVTVRLPDGRLVAARVTEHHAHVDPEGVRLRADSGAPVGPVRDCGAPVARTALTPSDATAGPAADRRRADRRRRRAAGQGAGPGAARAGRWRPRWVRASAGRRGTRTGRWSSGPARASGW